MAGTRAFSTTLKGGTLKTYKKKHFSAQPVQPSSWIPSLETKQCLILHTPPNEPQCYLPSLKSYHWWRWRREWEKGNRLTYLIHWNHTNGLAEQPILRGATLHEPHELWLRCHKISAPSLSVDKRGQTLPCHGYRARHQPKENPRHLSNFNSKIQALVQGV